MLNELLIGEASFSPECGKKSSFAHVADEFAVMSLLSPLTMLPRLLPLEAELTLEGEELSNFSHVERFAAAA